MRRTEKNGTPIKELGGACDGRELPPAKNMNACALLAPPNWTERLLSGGGFAGRGFGMQGRQKNADPAMRASGFERVDGDCYWTERWVTKALLDRVKFRGQVWEPACGRGDMVRVLVDARYKVVASDIAAGSLGCEGAVGADFLTCKDVVCESIITNPPFSLAEDFIQHSLNVTRRVGGMVGMLLRNEYDCAAKRRDLFEHRAFAAKLVLTKRPHWDDGLGQRSASPRHNYAWYVWDWQHTGAARIEWLP